jgi:predicted Rossmann-fold nucleotide-binding protein
MDEFFEILTLIQTKKIPKVPIILVGKDFWDPLVKFFEKTLLNKFETISAGDLNLFKILDDEDEIIKIIKKAKMRDEYK